MPTQRRPGWAAIVGLLLGGVCAGLGGCASPGGGPTRDAPATVGPSASTSAVIPIATVVAAMAGVRYADYASRPGVSVRDEAAFEEMRQYLLSRYRDVAVVQSVISGGVIFDCIPPQGTVLASVGATPTGPCPGGSVPVRRVTLDELVRFPTLAAFLGKGPDGEALPGRR